LSEKSRTTTPPTHSASRSTGGPATGACPDGD